MGASSFRSRSPTPEGPSKRPREDSEVVAEGTAASGPIEEPPVPERAARDVGEMVAARLGQAPEDLSAAPRLICRRPRTRLVCCYCPSVPRGAPALATLLTALVFPGCPGERDDVDPQEPITRGRLEGPPSSLAGETSKAGELDARHGETTPGLGFSRDFASLDEFLTFARTEVASPEVPLSLASSSLSAREADLAAREAVVRANEEMQVAEDMSL